MPTANCVSCSGGKPNASFYDDEGNIQREELREEEMGCRLEQAYDAGLFEKLIELKPLFTDLETCTR